MPVIEVFTYSQHPCLVDLLCFSDKRSLICTCFSSVCTTRSPTTTRSNVYGYNKLFTFILPSGSCIINLCSFECNELEHNGQYVCSEINICNMHVLPNGNGPCAGSIQ